MSQDSFMVEEVGEAELGEEEGVMEGWTMAGRT